MKSLKSLSLLLFTALVILNSCKKNKEITPEPAAPFDIKNNFLAGTLSQKSGSKYTSVFFIQFLEDNKALMINSSSANLAGTYTLTATELTFEVTGSNARIAKFTLDANKKITAAYYKALTTEYNATGELLPVKETNELAGKTFKGEEFKMGEVSYRTGLTYVFNTESTKSYGSGTDVTAIDKTTNNYTLIGGSGFKYINGSNVELGFVSNKKLTVFRIGGLYYYGKYDQQ